MAKPKPTSIICQRTYRLKGKPPTRKRGERFRRAPYPLGVIIGKPGKGYIWSVKNAAGCAGRSIGLIPAKWQADLCVRRRAGKIDRRGTGPWECLES